MYEWGICVETNSESEYEQYVRVNLMHCHLIFEFEVPVFWGSKLLMDAILFGLQLIPINMLWSEQWILSLYLIILSSSKY